MRKLPMTILVYGSLRSPEVLRRVLGVTGYHLDQEVSYLDGFKAYFLKGENYPVVIKEWDAVLTYQCLQIHTQKCFERCLLYEGEEDYELVEIGEGYLFYPTALFLAQNELAEPFEYEYWLENHHDLILKQITDWGLNLGD